LTERLASLPLSEALRLGTGNACFACHVPPTPTPLLLVQCPFSVFPLADFFHQRFGNGRAFSPTLRRRRFGPWPDELLGLTPMLCPPGQRKLVFLHNTEQSWILAGSLLAGEGKRGAATARQRVRFSDEPKSRGRPTVPLRHALRHPPGSPLPRPRWLVIWELVHSDFTGPQPKGLVPCYWPTAANCQLGKSLDLFPICAKRLRLRIQRTVALAWLPVSMS
jgi:hypothetical protein